MIAQKPVALGITADFLDIPFGKRRFAVAEEKIELTLDLVLDVPGYSYAQFLVPGLLRRVVEVDWLADFDEHPHR